MTPPPQLLLASASPRRQELLRQLGLHFEVMAPDVQESRRVGESPLAYVQRMASNKARVGKQHVAASGRYDLPVLGADTEVVIGDDVLGKPRDRDAGKALLRRLAGRTHEVITAICLLHKEQEHTAVSISRVTFGSLTEDEIQDYCARGESLDKAGGYGIQGLAAGFIARLEGSYSGVMGLPLYELVQIMKKTGVPWP